jgi:membrane associated rhomboid family serine protease
MIPLRPTRSPTRFPFVTVALVVVNVLVFIWELGVDEAAILTFAVVPANLLRGEGWLTPLTSMFLHGGLMHIAGNMLFLCVFAPAIEEAMGRRRFLFFYLMGGLAAVAAQVAASPASTVPMVGASGAIGAVMGAFLVTYPGERIRVLWFFGIFAKVSDVPAFLLVGVWLLTQMMNQVGAVMDADAGGVAYAAHVGGAVFGMLTARLFETPAATAAAE